MTKSVKQDILALMYSLTKNTDNQIMISTAAGTYIGNFVPEEKNDKYSASLYCASQFGSNPLLGRA